ncbi:hypothetical protein PVC01_000041300 [Plasmodium vivax]|uniref:VIR protein n=1 Tax=Plasmodium vivax TaxID=5855 RepID=A0A1G4ED15_PLAVI|nr:hypothetical protein PVC01_000041300 [Plasmodium vivax]
MIKVQSSESHGIDVCNEHIEEINDKIFEKFENLDSLYDMFYKFTNTQEKMGDTKCDLGKRCSEKYINLIKLCNPVSHIGFCKALDKFKDTYNNHMNDGPECFTPVYSWLHSILRKKSKIRNDLYEESRNLKNNDNIKKNNSKNSPLNIQYHSSENS